MESQAAQGHLALLAVQLMFPTLEQTPAALFPGLELPELVTDIVLWQSSGHSRAITVTG